MISLKPPVVPRPSIGGAPKAATTASQHLPLAPRHCRPCRDRIGREFRALPLGELLEHDVHRAQVGGIGAQDERLAGDARRCAPTPGVSRAIFSMWAMSFWVRSTEAESGNCTFSSR